MLLPKFRLEAAALRLESPPLIFFLGQNDLYTRRWHRRWAEEGTTHQGAPGLPSAPRWVVPTLWAPSGTYLLQYSSYIP